MSTKIAKLKRRLAEGITNGITNTVTELEAARGQDLYRKDQADRAWNEIFGLHNKDLKSLSFVNDIDTLREAHFDRIHRAREVQRALILNKPIDEQTLQYRTDFAFKRDRWTSDYLFMHEYVEMRRSLDNEMSKLGRSAETVGKIVLRDRRKIYKELDYIGTRVRSMLDKGVKKHLLREKEKISGRASYESGNVSQASIKYLYRYDPTIFPIYDPMFDIFKTKEEALTFMHQERDFRKQLNTVMKDRESWDREYYTYEGESMKINSVYNTMMYMYNRSSEYDADVEFIATRIISNVFETTDEYIDFETKYYSMLNAGYKNLISFMYQKDPSNKNLFPGKNKWERKNERLEKNQRDRAQRQRDKFEAEFYEEYGYELPF